MNLTLVSRSKPYRNEFSFPSKVEADIKKIICDWYNVQKVTNLCVVVTSGSKNRLKYDQIELIIACHQ